VNGEDTKHNQNNNHRWNQEGVPVNPKEYREPHTPEDMKTCRHEAQRQRDRETQEERGREGQRRGREG
jgi:hypothetical protein